jgi:uncharacterized protein YqeY
MTLQQRIESAMHDAMRARDRRRTDTLRMAMAAAQNRQIELRRPLNDADVVDVLSKQVKQRRESIELYRQAGREQQADAEEAEAAILAEFLPEQLSRDDLERLVEEAIQATGATGPKDLGKVMGRVAPLVKGRADGAMVSGLVRERLASGTEGAS